MASMLVAGTVAGVAPQIPTVVKSALAPQTAGVSLLDPRSAALQIYWPPSARPTLFRPDGDGYVGYIQLRNMTEFPQSIIGVRVQGADGAALPLTTKLSGSLMIDASSTESRVVTITLAEGSSCNGRSKGNVVVCRIREQINQLLPVVPVTGFLRVYTTAAESEATLKPSHPVAKKTSYVDQEIRIPQKRLMGTIFLGPLIMTMIVLVITAVNLYRKGVGLFHRMGSATWTFEKSWGANVTLGSALLVTLIGLTIFPDPPRLMTKLSYSLLQILFGALVSLAPLVYNLIRREVQVKTNTGFTTEIQGYVALFLIAGGLVLWAAMGQVATLAVLIEEFMRGASVDQATGRTLQFLALLLCILLLVYGFRSLYGTAKGVSAPSAAAGGAAPGPLPPTSPEELPAPMTEWSIL